MKLVQVAAVVGLLSAGVARADAGDVYLDLAVTPEAAWVSHPLAGVGPFDLPFAPSSTLAITPRTTFSVRYGLTDTLHIGAGLEAAPATGIVSRGVKFENTSGDLFSTLYVELALPLSLGWRFNSGENLTGVAELQLAPLVAVWGGSVLADPTLLDENGLPATLPADIQDQWVPGALVKGQLLFEARIWDWLVIAVGPEAGISWAGTLAVHAGLVLRSSLVVETTR